MWQYGFSILGLSFCHVTKVPSLLTLQPNTLFLQINSICGAYNWPPKNDPSESFLEKKQTHQTPQPGPLLRRSLAEPDAMPPARDTNNRDLVGGRTTGLAAGAELRKVHASPGSWRPGARASPEPEKLLFN